MASNEKIIWDACKAQGLNDFGAAGLMGNLYAESGLIPGNLQNSASKRLGMSDEEYTAAVDNGAYQNFVRDSAGYGLAQWTYWSRKQGLLTYAQARGKSVGDLETQLGFLFKELGGYKGMMETLRNAKSVREASDFVLLNFERPASVGASATAEKRESTCQTRAGYGQVYYDKYAVGAAPMISASGGMTEDEVRQRVVAIMQSWVGVKAGSAGHKAIIDAYNRISPLPRGHKLSYTEPWCAGTVSAAGSEAGYIDIMPAECSCNNLIKLYQGIGRWVEDDAYVPKPGDLVLYDWEDGKNYASTDDQGRADHVGMTEKVENGIIVVIEGNCGDQVARRNLKINGRYIRGFCCPDFASLATAWNEEDEDMVTLDTFKELMAQYRKELQDNDKGTWSQEARDWATGTGLITGNGTAIDGQPNYMWEDMLTREQAVQLFYRFAKMAGLV